MAGTTPMAAIPSRRGATFGTKSLDSSAGAMVPWWDMWWVPSVTQPGAPMVKISPWRDGFPGHVDDGDPG